MFKILVTSKSFAKNNQKLIETLEAAGIDLVRPEEFNISHDEIEELIADCDGLICGIDLIDKPIIDAGKKLKFIHMNGTGVDHIDVDHATKKGIYVGNCPGANAGAVAEYNLALLLAEARGLVKYSNSLRAGEWKRSPGIELSNKTIGVIGIGYIGKRFVELLSGFNMRVLVYDIEIDQEWVREQGVEVVEDLTNLFAESDFISLHVPLLGSTTHLINEKAISLMKDNVIIVNTARGGLIDNQALIKAIKEKRILGAALDAFDTEPIDPNSPLLDLDITLSPHVAASSIETGISVGEMVVENVIDCLVNKNCTKMLNYQVIEAAKTSPMPA